MANIDHLKFIENNDEQGNQQRTAKVLIITSANDDDNEKILSYLTPKNGETIFVNLNNNNKRSSTQLDTETWNECSKTKAIKRRKADLTCVICEGHAYGYNFDQITCESCKAFFRRNALTSINKTKCFNSNNGLRCNIRYDVKYKCQRCRLLKCLESGMRKDLISTPEEKSLKRQRLEANRLIRSTQFNNIKIENIEESPKISTNDSLIIDMVSTPKSHLTEMDWSYIDFIRNAYLSALQSTPSASSIISLELTSDKMSTYMNTLDLQNVGAVKSINFLRQIPDFTDLDENDRLILVKYNLSLIDIIRHALTFDSTREVCYDDTVSNLISLDQEEFAQRSKSLFILCYGYEITRSFSIILRTISTLIDKDPNIIQLLMLSMIFLKGLSANDDQEPMLNDNHRVFLAQSKFTDLLFRYLIERSSYNAAVIKMMHIVEILMKIQKLIRDFHQNIKSKIDINYVNPLMQSLLHLT